MRSTRWLMVALLAAGVVGGVSSADPAADAAPTEPLLNKATGHYYEAVAVPGGISFADARVAAAARTHKGVDGHLVSIGSAQEYRFLVENFPDAFPVRLPGTFPEECWHPTYEPNDCNFPYWLGGKQRADAAAADLGWRWITQERWSYTDWAAGEPNDAPGESYDEECVHPHPGEEESPKWNDIPCDRRIGGYFVEYPTCKGLFTTIQLTAKDDTFEGTGGRDVIAGLAGNDTINGLGGNDVICGDAGDDTLTGGRGKDRVFGNADSDVIKGAGGIDTLRGGPGRDTVAGGPRGDTVIGDAGRDKLFGNGGPDTLRGGPGFDVCKGGPGKDVGKSCEKEFSIP